MSDPLSVEEVLERLLRDARSLEQREQLPVVGALGRVLGEAVTSEITVPPLDNSAMDGYAVRLADVPEPGTSLTVSQRIAAGDVGEPLAPGTAARIFTGAPLPRGADAVVMQEDCAAEGDRVLVRRVPRAGENVRRAGEDVRAGAVVLNAGTRITAGAMGLAASVGCAGVSVFRRLRVALFSTGAELAEPGAALGPGKIFNSNRYALRGLLSRLGCEVRDYGIVPDDLSEIARALAEGAGWADVVLTTGGVSVGEEDHVKNAVRTLGELSLWKVAMKPGKPFAFGRIGQADFLGLPGNPVSTFVTFVLLVRPFLARRQGCHEVKWQTIPVRAAFEWPKAGQRREFLRARVVPQSNGSLDASIYPNQGSGVLTSVVWGDGLIDLPAGATVRRWDTVNFLPFALMEALW